MGDTQFCLQNKDHDDGKGSLSEEMVNSHQSIIQSENSKSFLECLFFLLAHGHYKFLNHIATADDEKYVNHCLEFEAKNMMLNSEPPPLQNFASSQKNESLNFNLNDANTSASSVTLSKGMVQCTWKQGIPHFVFCGSDQKEVYVAKLIKTSNNESLDYVYFFHKGSQKGHDRNISDTTDLELVGKMNVSTTFTLGHDNSSLKETHFVLFGDNITHDKEIYTKKKKKKKGTMCMIVPNVFRKSPSSNFRVSSPTNLLETNVQPIFELAAIIVKEHVPSHKLDKVGGWGLKFLNKKSEVSTTLPSESYGRSSTNEDCSTSMRIVIPAGVHGGPSTRHGGPSSLVDRWKSGGCCDCGGWDEGCPLTVLQRRSSNEKVVSQVDKHGQCKSFDFVTQGSRNSSPSLRLVNIHDGLYIVHFEPTLSALQSFSIAVAIIHQQSPSLYC